MIEVQAPDSYDIEDDPIIFLAGSIAMGMAEPWQAYVVDALDGLDCLVLNPRRDNFDPDVTQDITDHTFNTQVRWELDGLDDADIIVFYFDPNTKAPVTLAELGLHLADHHKKLVVCCPPGFWRRGNVQILCERYGWPLLDTLEELVEETVRLVK